MKFIQIIEFHTDRIDDFYTAFDAVIANTERTVPHRALVQQDRTAASTYLLTVEFETHELAMANSNRPEVGEFAASLLRLCDAPPTFRGLNVLRDEHL